MIFPWLRGILHWQEAPLTWTLAAINLFFFFLTAQSVPEANSLTKKDLIWTGRAYAQILNQEIPKDPVELVLKGSQALRDPRFYAALPTLPAGGDLIGFQEWKTHLYQFQDQLENRKVTVFGLRAGAGYPFSWVTYQFMHSGAWHLVGNMLMLILFGAALEKLCGSFWLVGIYLLSGISGAALFVTLSPSTAAPMVGASAALSGLMSFYALFEKRKRVRFFYFLSPSPGMWGDLYLPTLIILPLYFVEDLASYLSTAEEIGAGIAYTAHLGGAAFGIVLALTLRLAVLRFPQAERILYASYSRSQPEAP